MPLEKILACLLVLVVIVAVGNLWFHLVESLLEKVKGLFTRGKSPVSWHTLPPEESGGEDRSERD
ncbi:hypothetical protein [Pseudoflavonifractor phocaeensis]|uniref:hypothetical protein n=1 Tax=Pseudoflavonifractor phocaeensis TaxID=1870988 RepID=UPI0019569D38|nr:hypothetical protein [Pseudoflavonifractor phocaeensis]MBM6926474.1 hypothetical protein [Pseudoflavonifractor phocaeensis]